MVSSRALDSDETVRDVEGDLGHDRDGSLLEDRERVGHEPGERVLDRQHAAVDLAGHQRRSHEVESRERRLARRRVQATRGLLGVRALGAGVRDVLRIGAHVQGRLDGRRGARPYTDHLLRECTSGTQT
jgi:hypothetical protein